MVVEVEQDNWPLPDYPTAGAKHVHAMGVISLNYNNLEFALFRLFGHHLERNDVPIATAWTLYSQLQESRRPQALRSIFRTSESDEIVRTHVDHAIDVFNICKDNRNWLFHSRMSYEPTGEMTLTKTVKEDWNSINVIDVSLTEMRRVADDIFGCWDYAYEIWAYLQKRDFNDKIPEFFRATSRTVLPAKPDMPQKIVARQIPRERLR